MFSIYQNKNSVSIKINWFFFGITLDNEKSLMKIDQKNDERFTVKNKNKITLYTL